MNLILEQGITFDSPDLFWEKVDASGDCWEWTGAKIPGGYGTFSTKRAAPNRHTWMAYRVAYQTLTNEMIPSGMNIDHLCRNTGCVNPDHLEVVSRGENVLRGFGHSAQNARKTHCIRGHLFDESNTHITKTGSRMCRACQAMHQRRYRAIRRFA